jgi:hypothetical protein
MKANKVFFGEMILALGMAVTVYAGNSLEVVRATSTVLEVQLTNSDEIFGIQFSLHTSSDIILGETERCDRTEDSHWIVASYKSNDSTVNVLILSMERRNLPAGSGSIVKMEFSALNTTDISHASLMNVMITNHNADSLGIAVNDLEWNNRSALLAENGSDLFDLQQNYPNPFNPSTKIAYKLNRSAKVRLSIFDIAGREINRLVDRYQSAGEYNVEWNSSKQKLASGMYIAYLNVDNKSLSRKMVLTK